MGLTIVLSVGATVVIAYAVKAVLGLRPAVEDEEIGLDQTDHGEAGYHDDEAIGHAAGAAMAEELQSGVAQAAT